MMVLTLSYCYFNYNHCKILLYKEGLEAKFCSFIEYMTPSQMQNYLCCKFVVGEYGMLGYCVVFESLNSSLILFAAYALTIMVYALDIRMSMMKAMMNHLKVSYTKET